MPTLYIPLFDEFYFLFKKKKNFLEISHVLTIFLAIICVYVDSKSKYFEYVSRPKYFFMSSSDTWKGSVVYTHVRLWLYCEQGAKGLLNVHTRIQLPMTHF